ncbi:FAD-dependent oxidoreductase [Persicobacter diffluens]|uniref:FAD-dependent oxidoreductase n=1 Tax=Persicobacter diffluens TaxID=981 RepID=A0AAN4W2N4_9BACT|nr:hypothetical protein PEDI_39270 [Persicobacter diffluens]
MLRLVQYLFFSFFLWSCGQQEKIEHYDVLVVGGGTSGVAAGIQSARSGASTIILEEHQWLGGMLTSAGVSCVDGNHDLPSGFWGEFRDSLIHRYGDEKALATGWVSKVNFEPEVGKDIFLNMTRAEERLSVVFNSKVQAAERQGGLWTIRYNEKGQGRTVTAEVLIDATELGDIAAKLGVPYDMGMDARSASGEEIAPEQANDVIQDLTYVMILKDYGHKVATVRPENYHPEDFYCATDHEKCTEPKPNQAKWAKESMITYGKLPNGKYMINWPIDGNDYYANIIEEDEAGRERLLAEAKDYSLGFLYYLQTELGFESFGLDSAQFPTTDGFPFIPYHRESRRFHGLARFDVNHVAQPYEQEDALYRTAVLVGDYPIDHHHYRYPNWKTLPELHFFPVPSYGLPLGALVPEKVENLIVAEKSISVSNIVNGTTRLQPVVLQIGQAAGNLAATAVNLKMKVSEVPVRAVQDAQLAAGAYLLPYLDVEKGTPHFEVYQKIGATGLLRGKGMNVGWSNQTWLQIEEPLTQEALVIGIKDFTSVMPELSFGADEVSLKEGLMAIKWLADYYKIENDQLTTVAQLWDGVMQEQLLMAEADLNRPMLRGEYARILDFYLDPFHLQGVNYSGSFIK